ncbi:hypothetical protein HRI_004434300 [Hibiscus trionum]|uniref:Protein kinase domain-containing protein n=1 Tax=Hibiscus trionum TaxID=183268 RepID=A0A9W7J474_HIBTR|nr:hypothetical protein HRI_004434300 [Hibiscus trionum]
MIEKQKQKVKHWSLKSYPRLSWFPGEVFKDIVGSAYYIAPEVLRRRYRPEADIWSLGVMLYILLSGVPPFWAESENGVFKAILRGRVDFSSKPWPSISPQAKDLVKKMLNSEPCHVYWGIWWMKSPLQYQ